MPLGRAGQAQDIAYGVLFLAFDKAILIDIGAGSVYLAIVPFRDPIDSGRP